ncbi:telomere length regulation protein TEL2 homolog [Thrips palmi]|uniref:Telomere length regulation protein TEL2 homolog n=1 Tax=Thrips palmi TaxID=161013 RepID=A0A6P9AEG3_THRPL|nr:telomere length regulation protein TEL2 homolog [Thrips palmi]
MNNFVNMWRVRELADKVTNVVMNYTEIEAKVREATNDEAWGPTGALMQEIAQATFTYEHFPEVMQMLWKRMLQDNKKNWRRTYKSLLLLNYLVKNGSERVVTAAREHVYDLRSLENYTYVDDLGKDQGVNIRHKVKELMDFVQDDDRLREERKKAKKNKDKYVGMSSGAMGGRYGGDRWEEPRWRREESGDGWGGGGSSERTQGFEEKSSNHSDEGGYESDPEISNPRSRNYDRERGSGSGKEYKDNDSIGSGSAVSSPTTPSERGPKSVTSPIKKSSQPSKKVDLGAAAQYAKANSNTIKQSNSSQNASDLFADFGKDVSATSQSDDFFNPRGGAVSLPGESADFGDFTSAFGNESNAPDTTRVKGETDEFADFGSAFTSTSGNSGGNSLPAFAASGNAPVQNQNLNNGNIISSSNDMGLLNSDLLGGLSSSFSSLSTGGGMNNGSVDTKNNSNLLDDAFSSEWESGLDRAIVTLLDDLALKKLPHRPSEDCLQQICQYLPGIITTQRLEGLDEENIVLKETWNKRYLELIGVLVARISSDWPLDSSGALDKYFAQIIAPEGASSAMLFQSLKSLTIFLHNMPLSGRCHAVVALLVHLVQGSAVFSATLMSCVNISSIEDPLEQHIVREMWEECVRLLVSLPNRAANVMKSSTPVNILPVKFTKTLCYHVACCLSYIANSERQISIVPVSILVNRILVDFKPHNNDSGVAMLIRAITKWCAMDLAKVRSVVPALLTSLNKQAVESVCEVILRECFDLGCEVKYVLGKIVMESSDWKYVLCSKLPLLQYSDYNDTRVLCALASYLKAFPDFRPILKDLVVRLLSVWGDRSALIHTPMEQHIYVTQALVLFSLSFHFCDGEKLSTIPLTNLFKGVQIHLESPVVQIRAIGMITAEILTKYFIGNDDSAELKFDYSGMDLDSLKLVEMVKNLNTDFPKSRKFENDGNAILLSLAEDCGMLSKKTRDEGLPAVVPLKCSGGEPCPKSISDNNTFRAETPEMLDSDDDLEPFDMSNDKPISDRKKPLYLRDMLEGLYETEDMDRWCGSISSCEELVQKQMPQEDESLAILILEALISLEPRFPLENFSDLQLKGAIAVLCCFPSSCAEHLAKLFHKEKGTYSIAQRLLILHILTEGAQSLSSIPSVSVKKESISSDKTVSNSFNNHSGVFEEVLDEFSQLFAFEPDSSQKLWKKQIDERIASKTRRIASRTRVPLSFTSRFASVAGSFFFPLIRGMINSYGSIYLTVHDEIEIDDNSGILLRFILSLSVLMQCSQNAPAAPRMGSELLEFAWSIRYHPEASIRLAVIGCVMSVLVAVPQSRLQSDLRPALVEARAWLQGIACGPLGIQDTNSKCRELGAKIGALLDVALS